MRNRRMTKKEQANEIDKCDYFSKKLFFELFKRIETLEIEIAKLNVPSCKIHNRPMDNSPGGLYCYLCDAEEPKLSIENEKEIKKYSQRVPSTELVTIENMIHLPDKLLDHAMQSIKGFGIKKKGGIQNESNATKR